MKNLVLILLLLIVTACATTKTVYVPVEKVKTEYIHNTDSVYKYDSVYFYVKEKNDTIYQNVYKYKVLEKHTIDTLIVKDTIPVIKEVEKVVEVNHIYNWQRFLMFVGTLAVIYILIALIHKFKI